MSRRLRDLVLPISGDSSGLRSELTKLKNQANRDSASIGKAIDGLSSVTKKNQASIKSLSREFMFMGGEATKSLGVVHGAATNLIGAFASGGALGIGIMAATQGIGLLTRHISQLRQESTHLSALEQVFGITRKEVEDLSASLDSAGISIDRMAMQRLAALAKEANLSAEEVERVASEAESLAAINGTSIETEITNRIKELGDAAQRTDKVLQSIRQAVLALDGVKFDATESAGLQELQAIDDEYADRLAKAQKALDEARQKERWAHQDYLRADGSLANYRAAQEARVAAEERLQALDDERAARKALISQEVVSYAQKKEHVEAEKEATKSLENERKLAAQREAADLQAAINLALHRQEAEEAINLRLQQRLASLEAARSAGTLSEGAFETEALVATEQAEKERQALVMASLRAQADAEFEHRARMASLTTTQVDDLQAAQDKALEAVQRRIDDEVMAEEEGQAEIARIRDYYSKRIDAQIKTERDAQKKAASDAAKAASKTSQEAWMLGMQMGNAFAQGLRQALEAKNTSKIIGSLLGIVSTGLSLFAGPSGQIAGFGLSTIAGFFSEGGLIRGNGGPKEDNILIAASNGEFVQQASAVQKFGVPFMENLNRGILDLSSLPQFASGGLVGMAPAALSPSTSQTNYFQISALDPKSTLDVIGARLEPASVTRGLTRQDVRAVTYQRRRLGQQRTGR